MTTSFTTAKNAEGLTDLVSRSVGEYWLGGSARLIRNEDSTEYVFEFRGLIMFSFLFKVTNEKIQILETEGEVNNNIYLMYINRLMVMLESKNK